MSLVREMINILTNIENDKSISDLDKDNLVLSDINIDNFRNLEVKYKSQFVNKNIIFSDTFMHGDIQKIIDSLITSDKVNINGNINITINNNYTNCNTINGSNNKIKQDIVMENKTEESLECISSDYHDNPPDNHHEAFESVHFNLSNNQKTLEWINSNPPSNKETTKVYFDKYKSENSDKPLSIQHFSKRVIECGYTKIRYNNKYNWIKII